MSSSALDAQLLRFAEALTDSVVFTLAGRIIGCNARACALFGYERDELIGRDAALLRAGDDARFVELAEPRAKTGAFEGSLGLVRKDGARLEAAVSTVTVTAADGTEIVCTIVRDLDERQRAEAAAAALTESRELLQALSDAAFEGIVIHRNGVIVAANCAAELQSGVPRGGLQGKPLLDFVAPEFVSFVRTRVAEGDDTPYTAAARRADGTTYPCEVQTCTLPVQLHGSSMRIVAVRDISARLLLEEQFRQAQKMEAVGRLAGGIAHDFNNLLTVIMSATSHTVARLPTGDPKRDALGDVLFAAERAAELTRQLLTFSRKQVLQVRVIDVDEMVAGMESMLGRLIGEDVALHISTGPGRHCVEADASQLESMVMNLVVNARDSMPRGGTLRIESAQVTLDESWSRAHLQTTPGRYVKLSITDSGEGMSAETKERIFEPFFTTKGPGRGTGLGLSMVFGIVKQAGGSIWVDSERGKGTTFDIYLPHTNAIPEQHRARAARAVFAPSGVTILLVEDEPQVRKVASITLREAGFVVLEAGGGDDALALARSHAGDIDLLLTDVVMPAMNGKELADALTVLRPELRVLFMSGYTDDAIDHNGIVDGGINFLPKPLTPDSLLAKVRSVLDG